MWNCANFPWTSGLMFGHSLWGLLILLGIAALAWSTWKSRRTGNPDADKTDSLEILKIRLAKGEITIEEYNMLKSVL